MSEPHKWKNHRITQRKAQRALDALMAIVQTEDVFPGTSEMNVLDAALRLLTRMHDQAPR